MKKIASIAFGALCLIGAMLAGQIASEIAETSLNQSKQNRLESASNTYEHVDRNKLLRSLATIQNENFPIMVDDITRADSAVAVGESQFMYLYTILGETPAKSDEGAFGQALAETVRPIILNNYKTSDKMKFFRDWNIELVYVYRSESGAELVRIAISPEDF